MARNKKVVVLFLDIDGVLHPDGCPPEQHFCQLGNLEQVLRDHPAVRVVISSAWRLAVPLGRIRSHFSKDMRRRVVGVTRSIAQVPDPTGQRQGECQAWLEEHCPGVAWVAVDD